MFDIDRGIIRASPQRVGVVAIFLTTIEIKDRMSNDKRLLLESVEPLFRQMRVSSMALPTREAKRPPIKGCENVRHSKDEQTGRKFRVEYLDGSSGVVARVRGRVALEMKDFPPSMHGIPKLRPNGCYQHVYERKLSKVRNLTDESRTIWHQPMFKRRHTEMTDEGKRNFVTWYGRLGSYWNAEVASLAAEIAANRYEEGKGREEIERIESDLIEIARVYARRQL